MVFHTLEYSSLLHCRGNGKQSTELFNSVVSDLLESDKTLSLKTYEHVTGLLSNAIRNYIPKYGRPY
jgi:hypothetical protein